MFDGFPRTMAQANALVEAKVKIDTVIEMTVERLAGVANFLCSDAAENITGVALPVDDGWTAA